MIVLIQKWLSGQAVCAGVAVAHLPLGCLVENYRGEKEWNRVLSELRERGEVLELQEYAIKPVPDSENWGANPLLRELTEIPAGEEAEGDWGEFGATWDKIWYGEKSYKYLYDESENLEDQYAWRRGKERFEKWQSHLIDRYEPLIESKNEDPRKDLLKVLAPLGSHLEKLEEGLQLPHAVLPNLWTDFSAIESAMDLTHPQSGYIQTATQVAAFRSQVLLAGGKAEPAFRSLMVGLRFAELADSGPFTIDLLISDSCYRKCRLPLWMGLEKRSFSAGQLEMLQKQLEKRDFMTMVLRNLRAERALNIRGVEATFVDARKREAAIRGGLGWVRELFPDMDVETPLMILSLVPDGWIYQNFSRLVEWQDYFNVEPFASGDIALIKKRLLEFSGFSSNLKTMPYTFLATGGALHGKSFVKFFKTQVMIDQMIIACALERYFIDKGAYPDSLSALVPEYLDTEPEDRMASAPMRYLLTDDGRYRIYSVGWNQVDDGGVEFFGRARRIEEEIDDWVWQYSPTAKSR